MGGCLQTTKTVTGIEKSEETKTRNAFKAEVGLPVASVGLKPKPSFHMRKPTERTN